MSRLLLQPSKYMQEHTRLTYSTTLFPMEDDDGTYKQYEVKEGLVFLIDLSAPIFEPLLDLDMECQLMEVFKCINDLMSEMVITFSKNGVGIYLYNSKDTGKKFPKKSGISKVFSLNDLNSSNMKILSHIVRDQQDGFKPLKDRFLFETERQDNLHTVLKTILREFQVKPQYNIKKLFWITNSSTPYVNADLKDSLRTLISDFEDNKIYITPIFLDVFEDDQQVQKKPFDPKLYQHIFLNTNYLRYADKGETLFGDEAKPNWLTTTVSTQIRLSIFRVAEVRRIQFACDLILSDGAGIGGDLGCSVKGYTLYNHERVKHFRQVLTEGDGLKLVHNDTIVIRSDNHEPVETSDEEKKKKLVKGFPVKLTNDLESLKGEPNEKVVYLNPEVVDFMKGYSFDHSPNEEASEEGDESVGDVSIDEENSISERITFSKPPYLKLLCFRELKEFQPFFNMKPSVFVTADTSNGLNSSSKEGGYTESMKTFRALYQSCVKLKRYAVLFGCIKKNSLPDLFAFYPTNTANSTAVDRARKLPDGFLLISLPWLSEIRSLPDYMLTEKDQYFHPENAPTAPSELVNLYKKVIEQYGPESYVPGDHSNPVLSYFYKVIKHEALQIDIKDEDQTLEKNDWTIAKLDEMRTKAVTNVDVQEMFQFINLFLNKVSNMEAIKRTAEANREPAKKSKPNALSEAAIITLWKEDSWSKATVAQLKEFLAKYDKIRPASRKADMIANIVEFLESRQRGK